MVDLDSTVKDAALRAMIDRSYEVVVGGFVGQSSASRSPRAASASHRIRSAQVPDGADVANDLDEVLDRGRSGRA